MGEPLVAAQMGFPFAHDPHWCPRCGGYDRREPGCLHPHLASRVQRFLPCRSCKGSGYRRTHGPDPCPVCQGRRVVPLTQEGDVPR